MKKLKNRKFEIRESKNRGKICSDTFALKFQFQTTTVEIDTQREFESDLACVLHHSKFWINLETTKKKTLVLFVSGSMSSGR